MDFYAVLDQAVELLRQRGRVTYRALKLQFQLDDDQIEALTDELLCAYPQVVDDAGRSLHWTDTPEAVPPPAAAPVPAQDRTPQAYTPLHLAEKILTSRAALEGERKQVTVLFADLKGSMELLAERDPEEARLFPEREFTFKHALTHEVAYSGLLQERQRVLHARIVEALEALAPERLAEQVDHLAHHAFRGELWDKALAYGRQAGARAAIRSAHREAVAYFEQALVALAQLPERRDTLEQAIDVRFDLHSALMQPNEQARILDHLRVAKPLAERLGDDHRLARVAFYLSIYFSAMGEYDCAMAANQRALVLATSSGAFNVQVAAQTFLGQVYYSGGSFRQGLDVARQAMALLTGEQCYANFGMVSLPAIASRGYMVYCAIELGDFAEGRSVFEEAMQIAQAVGQPFSVAAALCATGMLSHRQGDLHRAIPVLERSLALYQSANILRLFPMAASVLGAAYALAGRAAEALPLLDQVLNHVAPGRHVIFQAFVLTELSEALLLVGRVDEASTIARRLLEFSHTHPGRGYQAHAFRLLGDVARHREPPGIDQATTHYRQALALAEETGMRPLQAHCHLGLGTLYAQTGQRQQAQAALSAAIDLYPAMDMAFWLPQAEAVLAQIEERA
jgi:tetratricopeptide (TPR) repeat protein